MTRSELERNAVSTTALVRSSPWVEVGPDSAREAGPVVPSTGITVYGCELDEAILFQQMAPRFGMTPTTTDTAISEASVGLTSGNHCISIGHKSQVSAALLRTLYQAGVRYISTRSVGYDHIDVKFAQRIGISVENIVYSPDSVADFTLMLMLMLVRNAKATLNRAQFHDFRLSDVRGRELRDMSIGVIGTGRIGTAVMDRLRGFGCRVLACDPRPRTSAEYRPLDEVLQRSDVVTLHTPLDTNTRHLLNGQRIGLIRPGALIVNTGRGPLLDTEALIAALECGRLGGAALDVLEGEEGIFYSDCSRKLIGNQFLLRLERLPNVIITPHTAYYTEHALNDIVEHTLRNCRRFESTAAACLD